MNIATNTTNYRSCGICGDIKELKLFKIDTVKKIRTPTNICLECWIDRMRAARRNNYTNRLICKGGTIKTNRMEKNKHVTCAKCHKSYSSNSYLKKHVLICDGIMAKKQEQIDIKLIEEERIKKDKRSKDKYFNINSCVKHNKQYTKIILY